MEQKAPEIAPTSRWRIVGMVCTGLLVLALAGGGSWLVLQGENDSTSEKSVLFDEITKLKDTNRELAASNQKLQTAATLPVDDTSVVTKTLRADCEAEIGMQTISATNLTIVLPFATANVDCTNPLVTSSKKTYLAILKKVNGTWTMVTRRSGTVSIDQATRDKYGIPKAIK